MRPLALPALLPALALSAAALAASPPQNASPLQEREQRFHGVPSGGGVVAAQDRLAAEVGTAMLRRGGNAVDAAVASAFALAVTLPQAGNLGGGGFLVLWLPGPSPAAARGCATAAELPIGGGTAVAVNFRETAPQSATAGMFLAADGTVDRCRATRSLLATGVPGTPAGLVLAQRCYGRLPLPEVLQPAIGLAEDGFTVDQPLAESLRRAAPLLQADPTSRALFFRPPAQPGGAPRPYGAGERLRQPELAATLRRIAAEGEAGFYAGPTAERLAALMRQGGGLKGGLISAADLAAYRAQLVRPLAGSFRGHRLLTMPPPSAGGVGLLQLLAILEPLPLREWGLNGAASLHMQVEAMNLVYRDRYRWLGDPDQVAMPLQRLLSRAYAAELRARIDPRRHRPAAELDPQPPPAGGGGGGDNTTHLSVADRQGGLVALTTTLNFAYGNGISVPGAGFLLNNEMDDFSAAPGRPNAFGLVQGEANAIAPGRRPLSSMTPALVFRPDGRPWLATGTPGGSRIPTTVLQVLLNRIVHGLNLATAVASPRVHSQLWPDRLSHEQGLSPDTLALLAGRGHTLTAGSAMGSANSVELLWSPGPAGAAGSPVLAGSLGVADSRRPEGAVAVERPPAAGISEP
ncbi:gamma-glutamyltransferase [Cyanobium sp. CH-040]|uniref:gamma-glutamyltransferase n=1 Tax=Cyanobium sp. CH-040 TaxID=2823708 RepID=UPI0020CD0642|nr:gamma-glutamyltransferase [Cyanobium sp. CH-040]MCP9927845.1 gamma-glutamyltransferase [Cyanobium sp. CH-040]